MSARHSGIIVDNIALLISHSTLQAKTATKILILRAELSVSRKNVQSPKKISDIHHKIIGKN